VLSRSDYLFWHLYLPSRKAHWRTEVWERHCGNKGLRGALTDSSEENEHDHDEDLHRHPALGSGSRLRLGRGATGPGLDRQEPHTTNERRRPHGSSWGRSERPAPLRDGVRQSHARSARSEDRPANAYDSG